MISLVEQEAEPVVVSKPLENLTPAEFIDIATQLGGEITVFTQDEQGILRASLNHLGSVISIDSEHYRRPGIRGPFLTVSLEGVTHSDSPLRNPSVEIFPGLVIFTASERQEGLVVDRLVQVTRDNLLQKTSTRRS